MKKNPVADNLGLVQGTLEQWLTFKKFLLLAFSKDEISHDAEGSFLEIKSVVARNVRTLGERAKDMGGLDYGDKIMRELLNKCVSATSVRALPEADKRNLYKQWHTVYVRLSRAVGALKFMSEGYVPVVATKGGKKKGKGGGKGGMVAIGVGLAIVAVIGAVVLAAVLGLLPI